MRDELNRKEFHEAIDTTLSGLQIKFVLNKNIDADIIDWLGTKPNKQGYIKELIRRDMEQNCQD